MPRRVRKGETCLRGWLGQVRFGLGCSTSSQFDEFVHLASSDSTSAD